MSAHGILPMTAPGTGCKTWHGRAQPHLKAEPGFRASSECPTRCWLGRNGLRECSESLWLRGTLRAVRSHGDARGSLGTDKATVRKKTR